MTVRIATAQYRIGRPRQFDDFASRVSMAVAAMSAAGAQIVVLPEYLSLEAAAIFDATIHADVPQSLAAMQSLQGSCSDLMAGLAAAHRIHLVAGTFLVEVRHGQYRNRAWLFGPDGLIGHQDKLCLTAFERNTGIIEPGDALNVFDTPHGRLGIAICYDVEFPLYARAQAQAGARLIIAPSCTDTPAGAARVRYGCQARAMENQLFVGCAVTAGEADWSPVLDVNTGRAAIYSPVDRGFPDDGIVAIAGDGDSFAIADIDLDALDAHRAGGQVGIAADWPQQLRPSVIRARLRRPDRST